jgi:hypothetical protein
LLPLVGTTKRIKGAHIRSHLFPNKFQLQSIKVRVKLKNAVFWNVTPCGSYNSQVFLCSMLWLLVTANVPSSPILFTLMMEVIRSSETSVLTRSTWHTIPDDGILHSHHRENLNLTNLT